MSWQHEIEELHDFFERWYDGAEDDFARCDSVLTAGFSIVGPGGEELDRAAIVSVIREAHGRGGLSISTEDHELLWEGAESVVARYVEVHQKGDQQTRRLSTVVFRRDEAAPNGLVWQTVHETWVGSTEY